MKELTKAEEQIMHILWQNEKAFINDIVDKLPDPKPVYTTVSTIVRILEQKGFVGHKAYGRTHEYFAQVNKEDYTRDFLGKFTRNYFNNSYKALASFFTNDENLDLKELEEIRQIIEKQISEHKNLNK